MINQVVFYFNLTISLALPVAIGYIILCLISPNLRWGLFNSLALSFGLGFGILTQWMLLLFMLKIPLNYASITIPLIFLYILCFVIHHRILKRQATQPERISFYQNGDKRYQKSVFIFGFTYICVTLGYVFFHSTYIPVIFWDSFATCAFKAKIFFYDNVASLSQIPHKPYPLHVPFIQSWIAFNLGAWDGLFIKIIFPFALVSFVIIQYTFVKIFSNKTYAIISICLLLSSNFLVFHATTGYRDLIMLYYNCTTIFLLIMWFYMAKDELLILSAIFAGLTTFVKLEGAFYLFIHTLIFIIILFIRKMRNEGIYFRSILKFFVPSYGIFLFFLLYKQFVGVSMFSGRTVPDLTTDLISRLMSIIIFILNDFFFVGHWNLIALIFIITLAYNWKYLFKSKEAVLVFISSISFVFMYIIFLTLTKANIDYPTTLSRVFLHFFPLPIVWITLINYTRFCNSMVKNIPK